ncbi:MAG: extracellular solute-binding protein [Firmicutes bacterium]|nr:extracellular solute-binding protein [Bacillota bacterium]
MRRSFRFRVAFGLAVLLSVAGYFAAAAYAQGLSGRLVVYSPHGDQGRVFVEEFQRMHPNLRVDYLFLGAQEVLDRLRAERGNPQADIWWGAPTNLYLQAKAEGLLQPYRPEAAGAIDPAYHDPDDYFYGTFLTPLVIVYNTRNVERAEAPKDWDDLIDPRWRGRIIIRDPIAAGTTRTMYTAMIWRFYRETGSPQEGYEWLQKLDANTHSYSSHSTVMFQQMARGVADITVWNLPDTVTQMQQGMPVDYVFPASGTPVIVDSIALVAGAPNPEAAKAFYEFVTSREVLTRFASEFNRMPARRDIPETVLPEWMTRTVKPLEIDWEVLSNEGAAWMRHWDENIRGRGEQ